MLRQLLNCAVFVVISTASSPAYPQTTPEAQLKALGDELNRLIVRGDFERFQDHLADHCIFINGRGEVLTRQQFTDKMRETGVRVTRMDSDDVRVKIDDDAATIISRVRIETEQNGRRSSLVGRITRIFRRSNGKWLMTSSQTTPVS